MRYWNDNHEPCEGTIVRRNGDLTLVRDNATGVESWRGRHEVDVPATPRPPHERFIWRRGDLKW